MIPVVETTSGHSTLTNTWGPTKQTHQCLDTRFADAVIGTSDHTIAIPIDTVSKITNMQVLSCEIPMSFTQFSTALQNTTLVIDGASLTVPDNNWTASTLTNQLTGNTTLTFTYDESTNRVSITNTTLVPSVVNFAANSKFQFDRQLKSKLGWFMGFRKPEYTILAGATLTAEGAFVAQTITALYLRVLDFQTGAENSMALRNTNNDILAKIILDPIRYPYGSVLPATQSNGHLISGTRQFSGRSNLDKVAIGLCDFYGRTIARDADFSTCLEITHM